MTKGTRLSLIVAVGLFLAAPAMAGEPICPGGSGPRADITQCIDLDKVTNCATGQESQCWIDNGYSGSPGTGEFRPTIANDGTAAAGSGHVRVRGKPGTTIGGTVFLKPKLDSTAFNLRYYVRFSKGYISFDSGHNVQLGFADPANPNNCGYVLKFQLSTYSGMVYAPGSCAGGPTSFNIGPNQGKATILQNNQWHLVEMHGRMDSSCTDVTQPFGCNGVFKLWLNEVLVTHYTNVNFGYVLTSGRMRFGSHLAFPQSYYHAIAPPWGMEIAWDNIAISSTGTYIGRAANENPRGIADPASPYRNFVGMEAFLGRRVGPDCAPYGYLKWRSGGTLQSAVTHGAYVDGCNSPPATDQALQVTLTNTSDGGGYAWERGSITNYSFPQYVIHGWVYLPSSNNYTVNNLALSGFYNDYWARDGYVAMSISNGKWAVVQKDKLGLPRFLVSTQAVAFNTWHEYEIIVWNDNTVSLMVDRQRLFTKTPLPSSNAWMFSGFNPGMVVGVIDFQGTAPFTVYYDDAGLASVSYWSCDGWGDTSCPFEGTSVGTAPPASVPAPSGLVVR